MTQQYHCRLPLIPEFFILPISGEERERESAEWVVEREDENEVPTSDGCERREREVTYPSRRVATVNGQGPRVVGLMQ